MLPVGSYFSVVDDEDKDLITTFEVRPKEIVASFVCGKQVSIITDEEKVLFAHEQWTPEMLRLVEQQIKDSIDKTSTSSESESE